MCLLVILIGSNYIVGKQGFTREAIAQNKGEKVNGRNIYNQALTSIAMCQMSLKYFDEFCPDGKLPSGKTTEDMLLYVRQKMYVHLKGVKSNKSNSRKKDGESDKYKIFWKRRCLIRGCSMVGLFLCCLVLCTVMHACHCLACQRMVRMW